MTDDKHNGHNDNQPEGGLPSIMGKGFNAQDEETAIREAVRNELEAIRSTIEQQIESLKRQQIDGELSEIIGELQTVLASIQTQLDLAATGTLAQAVGVSRNIPAINAVASGASSFAQTQADYQTAHLFMEMSEQQIHDLQAANDHATHAFENYERHSSSRIEALASANGIDINGYRAARAELQSRRDEAKAKGDRAGAFQADALLATNNVYGLTQTGASPEEIEKAKQEARNAEKRYLDEVRIRAREQAKAQGMNPDQTAAHITQATTQARSELQDEKERLAQENALDAQEAVEAGRNNAENRASFKASENERTTDDGGKNMQAVKTDQTGNAGEQDKADFNTTRNASDNPFAAALGDNKSPQSFDTAEVDHNSITRSSVPNEAGNQGNQIG